MHVFVKYQTLTVRPEFVEGWRFEFALRIHGSTSSPRTGLVSRGWLNESENRNRMHKAIRCPIAN